MENTLDSKTNQTQAIIKLEVALDHLEGVHQALSEYNKPRLDTSISLIEEILQYLKRETLEK